MNGIQTADKPRNRRNFLKHFLRSENFCLLRQQELQISVTYVYVCALICNFVSLSCGVFQRLAVC